MPNITVPVGQTLSFVVFQPNNSLITNSWFRVYRPDGSQGFDLEYISLPVVPSSNGATKFFSSYVFQSGDVFFIDYRELRTGSNVITHVCYVVTAEDNKLNSILSYISDIKTDIAKFMSSLLELKEKLASIDTYMRSMLQNVWAGITETGRRRR